MTSQKLPDLPSLQALKCLEAAVRHGNFTHAARELHVTQSAISHQIRALETSLECALFVRGPSGVKPTPGAVAVAKAVAHGLNHIAQQIQSLQQPPITAPAPTPIRLGAPPSLANRWLIARLSAFRRQHPQWAIEPVAGLQYHDLENGEVDATVRYGRGNYPGHDSMLLAQERLVAVCAPLWGSSGDLHAQLRSSTVLEAFTPTSPRGAPPSRMWSEHTGIALKGPVVTFNRQSMAVEAAMEGQGVAIVPWQIARGALEKGTLRQPVTAWSPDPLSYHLVWHPSSVDGRKLEILRQWLAAEMKP